MVEDVNVVLQEKYDGFCKKHSLKGHTWWLGTINLPRPERPINHNGKFIYG